MKKIEAITASTPFALDEVRDRLREAGVSGMTVYEVKGFGRTGGKSEVYRGSAYVVDFVPKIRIEVVVPDALAGDVVAAISTAAKTGKIGDGKIFVTSVDEAIRIRTGEKGNDADLTPAEKGAAEPRLRGAWIGLSGQPDDWRHGRLIGDMRSLRFWLVASVFVCGTGMFEQRRARRWDPAAPVVDRGRQRDRVEKAYGSRRVRRRRSLEPRRCVPGRRKRELRARRAAWPAEAGRDRLRMRGLTSSRMRPVMWSPALMRRRRVRRRAWSFVRTSRVAASTRRSGACIRRRGRR